MTTFESFSSGVTNELKSKKAIGQFDRSMKDGLAEAWGSKKSKSTGKKSNKRK